MSELAPCASYKHLAAKRTFQGGASRWCPDPFGEDNEVCASNRVFCRPRYRGYR